MKSESEEEQNAIMELIGKVNDADDDSGISKDVREKIMAILGQ